MILITTCVGVNLVIIFLISVCPWTHKKDIRSEYPGQKDLDSVIVENIPAIHNDPLGFADFIDAESYLDRYKLIL